MSIEKYTRIRPPCQVKDRAVRPWWAPQQQRAQTSRFLGEKEGKQEKAALLNLPFSRAVLLFLLGLFS